MKLAMTLKFSPTSGVDMDLVREAERLGYDAVWSGEAYGTDAVTPVAWVLAQTEKIKAGTSIMQMPARTPTCAAMTAMTLQAMSGNRFLCGIGPSGPQVVEGWHGVPFGKPLLRTREYIAIIRRILERGAPLEFHGEHYQIAPAGLRTAGKVADGTLPIFMSPEKPQTIIAPILEGMAKAGGGKTLADFDLAPYVRISMGEDLAACRDAVRPHLALYIGGMGARSKNYYNDLIKRFGYEAAAGAIQDHFLAGRRKEAEAAVPDALIEEISLVGTRERIRDRLQAWKELAKDHRIGTLVLTGATSEALRVVAEAVM